MPQKINLMADPYIYSIIKLVFTFSPIQLAERTGAVVNTVHIKVPSCIKKSQVDF